ncbi:MAG: 16S rRNA (adenine(1518)-N(6)/adenine(1519)-N(6))-dimethyltransferase RsmA [Terriglobia bacterium]
MPQRRRPRLGQHFLTGSHYCKRIVSSLGLGAGDLVIEIGAGRGALTGLLRERAGRVVAIEVDRSLAAKLEEQFRADAQVEIIRADILAVDFADICRRHGADQCYVVGNLPYYITSPIIDRLRNFRRAIRGMALLVQREVADRLVAAPGRRDYGYLSVSVQLFSQPRVLFTIPPGAFSPPPKVQSALVEFKMTPRFPEMSVAQEERFLEFVKLCFAHKRKSLTNNLSAIISRQGVGEELERLGLSSTVRAEQLTLEQFGKLFECATGKMENGPW